MNEPPKDAPPETPMQRALRLKNAAREAQAKTPQGKFRPQQAAGIAAGLSKPWMKR